MLIMVKIIQIVIVYYAIEQNILYMQAVEYFFVDIIGILPGVDHTALVGIKRYEPGPGGEDDVAIVHMLSDVVECLFVFELRYIAVGRLRGAAQV